MTREKKSLNDEMIEFYFNSNLTEERKPKSLSDEMLDYFYNANVNGGANKDIIDVETINSNTYNILRSKDGVVLQDEGGDYAYWDRHQGLQLLGQGEVNPSISGNQNIDITVSGTKNVAFKSTGMKLLSNVDGHGKIIHSLGDGVADGDAVNLGQLNKKISILNNLDDIQEGLFDEIANENSEVRAINKLGSVLSSNAKTISGIIDGSTKSLGNLAPVSSSGYGMLSIDFTHGSANLMKLVWTDEDGKIFTGNWNAQHWYGWVEALSLNTFENYVLTNGLISGNILVNNLTIG